MFELVIFDMAGTAINENNIVYKAIQSSMKEFKIEVSLEKVLELAGGKEKKSGNYGPFVGFPTGFTA